MTILINTWGHIYTQTHTQAHIHTWTNIYGDIYTETQKGAHT